MNIASKDPAQLRRRGWLQVALRVVVPFVAIGVALLLLEVALRIPGFESLTDLEPTLKGGPVVYVPNQVAPHRLGSEVNTEIRINSRGFKDDEYRPRPGDRTVVALGDSFTEGWGVDLDKTWVKELERSLPHGPGGYTHVYNAGRLGTNPKNYAEVYKEHFQADESVELVILGFCLLNDVIEPSTPARRQERPPSRLRRAQEFVSRYSLLYNVLRRRVRYSESLNNLLGKAGFGNPTLMVIELQNTERNRRRWPYTADFIVSFASTLRAQGRKFVVVLIPGKEVVDDEYFAKLMELSGSRPEDVDRYGVRDYMLHVFEARGVNVLDLTPVFQERHRHPEVLYFNGDSHWTAAGHRLAAETIDGYLRAKGLVSEPRANQ